jgi:hypothetical protein
VKVCEPQADTENSIFPTIVFKGTEPEIDFADNIDTYPCPSRL